MIAGVPKLLLLLLGLATLCGLVMGVCAAMIRARRVRRRLLDAIRVEREQHTTKLEQQADLTRRVVDAERSLAANARERAQQAVSRHDALQMHSSLQAQRIATLEAELTANEEQKILLQRDFATYKANKTREINLVRRDQRSGSDGAKATGDAADSSRSTNSGIAGVGVGDAQPSTASVPVLNKRVGATAVSPDARLAGVQRSHGRLGRIGLPLSRELEIPALTESELPDSVEELELSLVGSDDDGAASGG